MSTNICFHSGRSKVLTIRAHADRAAPTAAAGWLDLNVLRDGEKVAEITFFIPYDRATAVADAINGVLSPTVTIEPPVVLVS